MNKPTARLIKYLRFEGRIAHSFRRLAELYYPANHPFNGNQGMGEELVRKAAEVLGENWHDWEEELGAQLEKTRNDPANALKIQKLIQEFNAGSIEPTNNDYEDDGN